MKLSYLPYGQYHVALLFGEYSGHRKDTLVMQMRRCIDFLDCEAWKYLGVRQLTKKHACEHRADLLARFNEQYGVHFNRLIVD